MRAGAELVRATRPFAAEDRARTWRELGVTVAGWAVVAAGTVAAPSPWKFAGSALLALFVVRLFIFLHDAEHGAIFRGSWAGALAIRAIGLLTMNAPSVWRRIHDHHHHHNGEPMTPPLDRYVPGDWLNRTVTVAEWRGLTSREKWRVRVLQSPWFVVFGLLTAFVLGQGVEGLRRERDPRGLLHVALWVGLLAILSAVWGIGDAVAVLALPTALGAAFGVYLFYAQHHFPAAHIRPAGAWDPVDAALHASSFLELPPWLHWFTGNIAYHHVHHVNHQIPFYRLPEVMAALPELQSPGRTSLWPRDVWACFHCNVWDPQAGHLVSFAEAERVEPR